MKHWMIEKVDVFIIWLFSLYTQGFFLEKKIPEKERPEVIRRSLVQSRLRQQEEGGLLSLRFMVRRIPFLISDKPREGTTVNYGLGKSPNQDPEWLTALVRDIIFRLECALASFLRREKRFPSHEELARELQVSNGEVKQMLGALKEPLQLILFTNLDDHQGMSKQQLIKELKSVMVSKVSLLSSDEYQVISMNSHDHLSFKEIGRIMNKPVEKVIALYNFAVLKMRAVIHHNITSSAQK